MGPISRKDHLLHPERWVEEGVGRGLGLRGLRFEGYSGEEFRVEPTNPSIGRVVASASGYIPSKVTRTPKVGVPLGLALC
ncbi:hypothetical protein M0802_007566 [Mischocyttarus mexicanus]|nr:hypothetical protein M0802_007566 [Mischocyttarus mexicanus]